MNDTVVYFRHPSLPAACSRSAVRCALRPAPGYPLARAGDAAELRGSTSHTRSRSVDNLLNAASSTRRRAGISTISADCLLGLHLLSLMSAKTGSAAYQFWQVARLSRLSDAAPATAHGRAPSIAACPLPSSRSTDSARPARGRAASRSAARTAGRSSMTGRPACRSPCAQEVAPAQHTKTARPIRETARRITHSTPRSRTRS